MIETDGEADMDKLLCELGIPTIDDMNRYVTASFNSQHVLNKM